MPVTTPARTAFDLGRRDRLETPIIRVDALANATGLKPDDVQRVAEGRPGARGMVQLRRVLELMDGGAESPQETRTRLLLIAAGFPKPQTQIVVVDEYGEFVGRVDMGGRKGRSASNTRVRNIGRRPNNTLETSTGWPTSPPKAG
jgi:hypothetical protein